MGSDRMGDRSTTVSLVQDRTEERTRGEVKSEEQDMDELGRLRQRAAELETPEVARHKTVKPLRSSDLSFRTFIEHLPNTVVYMASLDERSTTRYVSPQVEQLLGYTQEEYEAEPDIWAKRIHPDDFERVMAEVVRCRENGEEFVSEYRMIRKDGRVIWFHDEASVVRNSNGDPLYLIRVNTDITDRKRAEEALRKREAELQVQSRCLEEANTTLKVLLDWREKDRTQLEKNIQSNVKEVVIPYLEELKNSRLDSHQQMLVDILASNIKEMTTSFVKRLSSNFLNLTPSEIRIAGLIRDGRTTKEIAALLNLSENTILFHRYNIRSKLGLKNKKVNLNSHLRSFDS